MEDDETQGMPGRPGKPGTRWSGGRGGEGGQGGAGGVGTPGGAGGTGGEGGRYINHRSRRSLADATFFILVILVPIAFGLFWTEHQSARDTARIASETKIHAIQDDWQLYDGLVAACERVNVIRTRQNIVVSWIHGSDPSFPLEPEPLVVCTEVVHRPTLPRP